MLISDKDSYEAEYLLNTCLSGLLHHTFEGDEGLQMLTSAGHLFKAMKLLNLPICDEDFNRNILTETNKYHTNFLKEKSYE